jgi:hypothetical protein
VAAAQFVFEASSPPRVLPPPIASAQAHALLYAGLGDQHASQTAALIKKTVRAMAGLLKHE